MKKIVPFAIIAFLSVMAFVGCAQSSSGGDSGGVAAVFQPIIGTWTATTLGIPTTLVFNTDETTVETTTVLGVGSTKSGKWTSNDKTITRTWSDGSIEVKYYVFADAKKQMIMSNSPDGAAITYFKN